MNSRLQVPFFVVAARATDIELKEHRRTHKAVPSQALQTYPCQAESIEMSGTGH
jgi:hypothetical protein